MTETMLQFVALLILIGLLLALPWWLWDAAGWVGAASGVATWALAFYTVSREHRT